MLSLTKKPHSLHLFTGAKSNQLPPELLPRLLFVPIFKLWPIKIQPPPHTFRTHYTTHFYAPSFGHRRAIFCLSGAERVELFRRAPPSKSVDGDSGLGRRKNSAAAAVEREIWTNGETTRGAPVRRQKREAESPIQAGFFIHSAFRPICPACYYDAFSHNEAFVFVATVVQLTMVSDEHLDNASGSRMESSNGHSRAFLSSASEKFGLFSTLESYPRSEGWFFLTSNSLIGGGTATGPLNGLHG